MSKSPSPTPAPTPTRPSVPVTGGPADKVLAATLARSHGRFARVLDARRGASAPGSGNALRAGVSRDATTQVTSGRDASALAGPPAAQAAAARGRARPEPGGDLRIRATSREAGHDGRENAPSAGDLAPFRPSPILLAPPAAVAPTNIAERADVASIVERIVVAMRVGTAGRGHAARFTFGGRALDEVSVELVLRDGRLQGVFRAPSHRMDAARRVADAASESLRARGIELDDLSVERAV